MYGTQDASRIWAKTWQSLLKSHGYKIGKSNSSLFWHPKNGARGLVHGGDFLVLASDDVLREFEAMLKSRFEAKRSPTIGFSADDAKELNVLQRTIRVVAGSTTQDAFIAIEADVKHVPSMVEGLGLQTARVAATPRTKRTPETEAIRLASHPLTGSQQFLYRSQVMRASYLSQDRPDVQESVRILACSMSEPRLGDLADLKRLARYLKGRPRADLQFPCQWGATSCAKFRGQTPFNSEPGSCLHIFSDADWAGDPTSRKSATGFVAMRAGGCLRSSSTTQTIIGLSSCESEFYALCRASASGIGIQSNLVDLGIVSDVLIWSDASAARAVASRRGLGKVRHLHTRYLWLQDAVSSKAISLRTIPGKQNPADAFTKALSQAELDAHMARLGLYHM